MNKKLKNFIRDMKSVVLNFLFPQKNPTKLSVEQVAVELQKPEVLDDGSITVISNYNDKLAKKLIWELKYKNNAKAGRILAEIMYVQLMDYLNDWTAFEDFRNPILVPVPISAEKREKRGYNQAEILIQEIMKMDNEKNLSCELDCLIKIKDTKDQSSLKTKTERLRNLKGCFAVKNTEKLAGRNIIIVDDVVTTGATIKEIKKILKKEGVKKVKAFVVAH